MSARTADYHPNVESALEGIRSLLERGGVVMVPLMALSVVTVALILERTVFWLRLNRRANVRRVDRITRLLARGDERANALIAADRTVYGGVAQDLLRDGVGDASAIAAVERARPRIERYVSALSTIITAAPLLGILGTVTGIIRSFGLLGAQENIQDLHEVSAGIAEALLNTALGIAIALIAVFPYMIFRGQANRALGRFEAIIAAAREGAARRAGEMRETSTAESRTTHSHPAGPMERAVSP